jgi:hypothetical protein
MRAKTAQFALGFLVVTVVSACAASGGGARFSPPTATQPWGIAQSLLAPDASALLYVSDPSGQAVSIYTYPDGKKVSTIPNLYQPGGMCVSKSGNVFIADQSDSHVRVYAHGSTKVLRTLSDPNYTPFSCTIDPISGNLAVTSINGTNGHGSLAVYAHAIGSPKVYDDVNIPKVFFAGYDRSGNLFIDGETKSRKFVAGELAKGATSIKTLTLNQAIGVPGAVQWDGKHIAIGDVTASVIYQFSISSGKGTKVGSTPLKNSALVDQYWIQGTTVIAPDFSSGVVRYYKYPNGGAATKTISDFYGPIAVTVSP